MKNTVDKDKKSLFSESLGQSKRSNPFTIENEEAKAVETSGRLVQVQPLLMLGIS